MIINVKATRPDNAESASAHSYRFGEEPTSSRWPLAFGAFLIGIALYIKSMFPGWGEAVAEAPPETGPSDAGHSNVPPNAGLHGEAGLHSETTDAEGDTDPPTESPIGSGGPLLEFSGQAFFSPILSPEIASIDFAAFSSVPRPPAGFAGIATPANDNPVPDTTDVGGGDPGGNGTDGPGLDDPDDPTSPDDDPDDTEPADEEEEDEEQPNRAPRVSGSVYLADVAGCSIALIGLSDLLVNATDPDGDTLSIRNITASSGMLSATQNGWNFESAGYGPVTITYEITDGALAVTQTAHLNVVRNNIAGGFGDDLLVGTECGDDIDGGDGHDNIDARGGNDIVAGGGGNDHIVAGAGGDTVFAGLGNDIVFGGVGDDWISGGEGNDRLFGNAGADTLFGDEGDDWLSGDDGQDLLFGGEGKDYLYGDEGDDRLSGGADDDELHGGEGGDVLMGEAGADRLYGDAGTDSLSGGSGEDQVNAGAGDDTVIGDLDGADDSYDGGAGFDTLSYVAARHTVTVDLEDRVAQGVEIGADQICSFEVVEAGAGDDRLSGSDADEVLLGNQGNDRIAGGDGDDIIIGGDGCDTLAGDAGEDQVDAGAGDDTVVGDLDSANDTYDGGAGTDTIDYSAATASVSFDLASGKVTGVEIGEDTISNFEGFIGGTGDDHFRGNGNGGSFRGGGGNDVFEFEAFSGAGQRIAYDIYDFMVGDRIKVSRYEIFEEVMDSLEDRFEDVYGDDIGDGDMPILISHERTGDIRRTLIEADLNNDNEYELTITIYGDSQVSVVETV